MASEAYRPMGLLSRASRKSRVGGRAGPSRRKRSTLEAGCRLLPCTVGEVYKAAYPAMKVAGEAVEARKRAAQEARRQRQAEARKKKIETLRSRLAKKQQALERARKPETRARYSEEKEKIERELAAAIREYLTVQVNMQTVALERAASLHELPGTDGKGTVAGIATELQSDETGTEKTPVVLSDAQSQAYSEIKAIFRSGKPALLHG